eukprot:4260992-Prymnesium_polylepis.1
MPSESRPFGSLAADESARCYQLPIGATRARHRSGIRQRSAHERRPTFAGRRKRRCARRWTRMQ